MWRGVVWQVIPHGWCVQADDMGQKIACASCYSPEDSIKMLDNMIRFQHEAGGTGVAMLSTHPVGEARQCQAGKQVEELQHKYDIDSNCHHTQKLLRMV